jgi:hypothetical protein
MSEKILRDYLEQAVMLLLEVQDQVDQQTSDGIDDLLDRIDLEMQHEELDEDLPVTLQNELSKLNIKWRG